MREGFPGFDHTHWLSGPASTGFRVRINVSMEVGTALLRGEYVPRELITADWTMGSRKPTDLVWTTLAVPIIASRQFVETLEVEGFTGWSVYEVELRDGAVLPDYAGLVVTGRCGRLRSDLSEEILTTTATGKPMIAYRGLFFESNDWDGSDMFMSSELSGFVFVTDAVKKALTTKRITGGRFHRLDSDVRPFRT